MNALSRRTLITGLSAVGAAVAAPKPAWKPKLGILGRYTPANLQFAKAEGCTSMGIWANKGDTVNPATVTDAQLEQIRGEFQKSGIHLSVVGATANHIAADPQARREQNESFAKVIEIAGKLGAPYVGTASGTMPGQRLQKQVDEIVGVYEKEYFPLCQKYKVRILWEPWPDGPNVATGPQGYEALFKAFGNSPYVGLQYDPSHLVRLFMDPLQCARDFADKIYDVHLKDTEIRWHILKKVGIRQFDRVDWWRYRIPGSGQMDWPGFFTVLQDVGFTGAMNIEHEDEDYGAMPSTADFSEDYKTGFRVGMRYLRQYVPV